MSISAAASTPHSPESMANGTGLRNRRAKPIHWLSKTTSAMVISHSSGFASKKPLDYDISGLSVAVKGMIKESSERVERLRTKALKAENNFCVSKKAAKLFTGIYVTAGAAALVALGFVASDDSCDGKAGIAALVAGVVAAVFGTLKEVAKDTRDEADDRAKSARAHEYAAEIQHANLLQTFLKGMHELQQARVRNDAQACTPSFMNCIKAYDELPDVYKDHLPQPAEWISRLIEGLPDTHELKANVKDLTDLVSLQKPDLPKKAPLTGQTFIDPNSKQSETEAKQMGTLPPAAAGAAAAAPAGEDPQIDQLEVSRKIQRKWDAVMKLLPHPVEYLSIGSYRFNRNGLIMGVTGSGSISRAFPFQRPASGLTIVPEDDSTALTVISTPSHAAAPAATALAEPRAVRLMSPLSTELVPSPMPAVASASSGAQSVRVVASARFSESASGTSSTPASGGAEADALVASAPVVVIASAPVDPAMTTGQTSGSQSKAIFPAASS